MKMLIILRLIAIVIIAFDIFMVSPFGIFWMMDNMDEHKPCYGVIFMFVSAIPLIIILTILNLI